jgi:hypothetical protein
MPRYAHDYQGISARDARPRGLDPNHRDGYQGMRVRGGRGQAPYGAYRFTHAGDFEGSGGYQGRYAGDLEGGSGRQRGGYDRLLRASGTGGGGGVHDWRYDTEYLRQFNSESPRFRQDGRWGRSGRGSGSGEGARPSGYDGGFRWDYANRGMSRGGYTDSWTWGPMRGSR